MRRPARLAEPTSPLGYPQYRELWLANGASNFGSQIQVVGAGWLMASLTHSPQVIAFVQTAINLPTVLFILMGGAIADNFDRRRIMLAAQSGMLLTAVVLATLTWRELINPWSLLALTFVMSALGSLSNPAWQASVRDILPRAMINRAVALNSTSINLARTAGPALGGMIIVASGVAMAFIANALSFVGFLVALLRWKPLQSPRAAPRERILPAMAAGARYASLAPHIRNAVVRGGLSGLSAAAMFALLPVVARQEMQGDAMLYGLLLAAFGGGAVLSALAGGRLRERLAPDHVVFIAATSMTLGLAILGMAPNPWLAGLGAALGGGGWTLTHSTYNTTVQLAAPKWVTARALALYQTATFAGMATGSILFGWIAEHHGVSAALLGASAAHGLAACIGFALPLPLYKDLRVDPLETWSPPTPDLAIADSDGPVFVELTYRIAPENLEHFLAAMRIRERIRRRDGARNWALWQDVMDHMAWIETYQAPDWAEYLRHNRRRTQTDQANAEALLAVNADPGGPTVRRYVQRQG